ncbi:MAG: helix-turn-helix transcriptional regulator [Flavobacterium sp.]|nr:helix-turn-helix transcriptional regulator [Flavobacterium sp.]
MVEKITARISQILKFYNLSAASFADKLGVQRSGLSHILSGRNKPSLDFIIKITNTFDEIDVNWLLHGKGSFPKQESAQVESTPPLSESTAPISKADNKNKSEVKLDSARNVAKIVVFYTDGTFSDYSPRD